MMWSLMVDNVWIVDQEVCGKGHGYGLLEENTGLSKSLCAPDDYNSESYK
jgi:hypothetical protein